MRIEGGRLVAVCREVVRHIREVREVVRTAERHDYDRRSACHQLLDERLLPAVGPRVVGGDDNVVALLRGRYRRCDGRATRVGAGVDALRGDAVRSDLAGQRLGRPCAPAGDEHLLARARRERQRRPVVANKGDRVAAVRAAVASCPGVPTFVAAAEASTWAFWNSPSFCLSRRMRRTDSSSRAWRDLAGLHRGAHGVDRVGQVGGHEQDVVAGLERLHRALRRRDVFERRRRQRVGDDDAVVVQGAAQQTGDDRFRDACRARSTGRGTAR